MNDKRFLENPDEKKYQIDHIWDHHRAIIRCLVASNGKFTNEQIAKSVGCSAQTVSNVRNNPLCKEMIDAMQAEADDSAVDVAKEIKKMFPIAARVLSNTMKLCEDEVDTQMADPRIIAQSVSAAKTIFDHAHPKQIKGEVIHGHLTLSQIMAIKNKAIGSIEEATVISIEGEE